MARVIGLDWSGARHPATRTWLASGELQAGVLTVHALHDLAGPMGDPRASQAQMLAWLHAEILASDGETWVGIDAPLSLAGPDRLALGASGDLALIRDWPLGLASADELRQLCRQAAAERDDGHLELRRPCDVDAHTPWAPTNLRLYRQTWAALSLAATLHRDGVAVLPWQSPGASDRRILEACPASLWAHLGVPTGGYKKEGAAGAAVREELLHELAGRWPVRWSTEVERIARTQTGGDALDALAVAVCTAFGAATMSRVRHSALRATASAMSGRIYLPGLPLPDGEGELPP